MSLLKRIAKTISKSKKLFSNVHLKEMNIDHVSQSTVYQSAGNMTIIHGVVEQLQQSFYNLDFSKATEYIEIIKHMTNVNDEFEFSYNTADAKTIKLVPKTSVQNPNGVIQAAVTLALPSEYERFRTSEELVRFLYHKQITLTTTITKLKISAGNKIIEEFCREAPSDAYLLEANFVTQAGISVTTEASIGGFFQRDGDHEFTITPPPFGPPMQCLMETYGKTKGLPLQLRLVEIEESDDAVFYHLSNKDQDIPVILNFSVQMSRGSESNMSHLGNFHFEFRRNESEKYYKILLARLLIEMKKSQVFILRHTTTGKIICQANGMKINDEQGYKDMLFWALIGDIEDGFNVDFVLPKKISRDDFETLGELSEILNKGISIGTLNNLTATINSANSIETIISQSDSKKLTLRLQHNRTVELFGKTLELGATMVYTPPLQLMNRRKLISKLKSFQMDDDVEVSFRPLNKEQKTVTVYPKFYGTSNNVEIEKRENLPGRWFAEIQQPTKSIALPMEKDISNNVSGHKASRRKPTTVKVRNESRERREEKHRNQATD